MRTSPQSVMSRKGLLGYCLCPCSTSSLLACINLHYAQGISDSCINRSGDHTFALIVNSEKRLDPFTNGKELVERSSRALLTFRTEAKVKQKAVASRARSKCLSEQYACVSSDIIEDSLRSTIRECSYRMSSKNKMENEMGNRA